MNFSERLFAALADGAVMVGRKLTKGDWLAITQEFYLKEHPRKRRRSKTDPKPRTRDGVFDCLVALANIDPAKMTRSEASKVGEVKAQILEVMQGAEIVEIVAEIHARAAMYKRIHPKWEFTITALVGHWSSLGGGEKTGAEKLNIYVEPAGWQATAIVLYPGSDILARPWPDLAPDVRKEILKAIA